MKKTALFILAITAIAFSRLMFVFFNDPEGPNLLIVMVAAVIVWGLSLITYTYRPWAKQDDLKKLLLAIFAQILIVAGLYLCLS